MHIAPPALPALAQRLMAERKLRGWSRPQAAALCGVSLSFLRDAESHPGRCTLERLLRLCEVLGVQLWSQGWQTPEPPPPPGTELVM